MERFLKSKYKIGDQIGESPFSITYKGTTLDGERPLVIKIYKRALLNNELIKIVKKKVRNLREISHHNIAKILDGDYGWQGFYFVREFIEGKSLAEIMDIKDPLDVSKATKIAQSICEALHPAHEMGVIHGALKPENVFLASGNVVKVADFVVYGALRAGPSQTSKTIMERAKYLSPEEVKGEEPKKASDIYLIGVLLYQMLTARHPFEGSELDVALAHIKEEPEPPTKFNSKIPDHLEDIIYKAMEKDPMLRFESVAELLSSLKSKSVVDSRHVIHIPDISLDTSIDVAKEKELSEDEGKGKKKNRLKFWLILLVSAAVLTGIWYAVFTSVLFK